MTLDVRLLGQLTVLRDGQQVELRSLPAQRLLAYLVLHSGRWLPREKIAGELWPDATAPAARKKLRQTLWRLRRAIGDATIDAGPGSLRLQPGAVTSDVARLLQDDVGDEPAALAAAVDAYRGELLPGHYDEWIRTASAPLRATFEDRMGRLLGALAHRERWDELRGWAEHWIAEGAVPEPAYRALMRAHAGMGDLAGVANAYHRCVRALQTTLGVEPSPATRALHDRLLAGADGSSADTGNPAQAAASALPMPSIRCVGSDLVIEQSVVIDRAPAVVYAAAVDPDLALLCRATIIEYEVLSGTPGHRGVQVRATRKIGRELVHLVFEAVAAQPGRWLRSRAVEAPFDMHLETRVEAVAGGTRMTQCRELEIPDGFFGGLDDAVAARLYASEVRSDLGRLKQLLEVA